MYLYIYGSVWYIELNRGGCSYNSGWIPDVTNKITFQIVGYITTHYFVHLNLGLYNDLFLSEVHLGGCLIFTESVETGSGILN